MSHNRDAVHNIHETDKALNLFTARGERKYLSGPERERFYKALDTLPESERTFCEMIFWTGCRPSEALALTVESINLEGGYVVIRSLKKRRTRGNPHFRIVPVPRNFIDRLSRVHGLSFGGNIGETGADERLWPFSRTTGWVRMATVMKAAGISGAQACARGLRHGFGVHAALMRVLETRIQKWLGHANLATTAIYLDMAALEDREWRGACGGKTFCSVLARNHRRSFAMRSHLISARAASALAMMNWSGWSVPIAPSAMPRRD